MLRKVLKKLIALTATVATVATMVAPVSASTLTPKKSHSDAEVQERVLYLIDAADDIAFSPYSGFSGNTEPNVSYRSRHKTDTYLAYACLLYTSYNQNVDKPHFRANYSLMEY